MTPLVTHRLPEYTLWARKKQAQASILHTISVHFFPWTLVELFHLVSQKFKIIFFKAFVNTYTDIVFSLRSNSVFITPESSMSWVRLWHFSWIIKQDSVTVRVIRIGSVLSRGRYPSLMMRTSLYVRQFTACTRVRFVFTPLTFHTLFQRVPRTGWVYRNVKQPESVSDHMYRMAMMALTLQDPSVNRER